MFDIRRILPGAALVVASLLVSHASAAQDFSGTIGAGVAALPRYTGSDEYRVLPLPVLQLEFGRVYLGGSSSGVGAGLGVYLLRGERVTWDVGLAGSESRPERRGDALAGMGTRKSASYGSTTVALRLGMLSLASSVAIGLGDAEGSYGTVNVSLERRLTARLFGGLSSAITIADTRHMAFEFGVSDAQSARRRTLASAGDPRLQGVDTRAYAPESGLKQASAGATLAYLLTERTRAVLLAQATQLGRDAFDSPIVRARRGATTAIAIAWAF